MTPFSIFHQTHDTTSSFALLAVWGCVGSDSGGENPAALSTFERIQTQVFDVSCSSDSCHSTVGQTGGLILEAGYSYESLMNTPPANPAAYEHGWMRVMPGDPDRSFLLAKLTDTLAAGEGGSMPWNATPLDADTIAVIRAWILAGAPQEGLVPGDDGCPLN